MKKKPVREQEPLRFYKTFWSVFNAYRETDYGSVRAITPDKGSRRAARGVGHVKPNRQDFVADVETAAKAVLTPFLYRRFIAMCGKRKVPDSPRYLQITELCGAEFARRGIHPLNIYFKENYCVPERRNNHVAL